MDFNELLKKYSDIEDSVYDFLVKKYRTNRYSEEVTKSNPAGIAQAMINMMVLEELKKFNENFEKSKEEKIVESPVKKPEVKKK